MTVDGVFQGYSRTALKKKPARSTPLICMLDFTGFAMVMVLVVFVTMVFLMILPPLGGHGAGVDMAKAYNSVARPRASREDAIVITIARDGKVYVGSDILFLPALPGLIHNHLADGGERKVYLRIDRHARYGDVPPLLAKIRSAGVENISFLVEQRSNAPTGDAADQSPRHGLM
jgi:biopolymer transport protein TolR